MSITLSTAPIPTETALLQHVALLVKDELSYQVESIDREGVFPRDFMRHLGEAGVYAASCPTGLGGTGLGIAPVIAAMEEVSKSCMSTGFCVWCDWVCGYYIRHGQSQFLKREVLPQILSGERLGATGMSNPMKHFADIESLNLRARKTDGGFIVNGALPWVSNLAPDGFFAAVARVEEADDYVMFLIAGDAPGLTLGDGGQFVALEGSSTHSAILRDAFISNDWVLAHPCTDYIFRIRPGFIVGQTGFGLGVISACLDIIERANKRTGHVNCFLDDRADNLRADYEELRARIFALAEQIGTGDILETPSKTLLRGCVQARLDTSELSLRASQAALLHAGAGGYRLGGTVDRKLRESYFVAIVTPASKHLKKMLAGMNAPKHSP